jgi:pimeloyl-ACP methyl ester carboxylesterase
VHPPPTLLWHHGSPQSGALLPPVLQVAGARGMRAVSIARPGYGGSSELPSRDVAVAGRDAVVVLDSLGVDRVVAVGASGGAPHALAAAEQLADRAVGVLSIAGLAPFSVPTADADGKIATPRREGGVPRGRGAVQHREEGAASQEAWFEGMLSDAALRAATRGRDARLAFAQHDVFDPTSFTPADWAALEGEWASLGADAEAAGGESSVGLVDDDVAFVRPWGVDLAAVRCPVLLVHGEDDRVVPMHHADRLATLIPAAQVWRLPGHGHVSVLTLLGEALDRLRDQC